MPWLKILCIAALALVLAALPTPLPAQDEEAAEAAEAAEGEVMEEVEEVIVVTASRTEQRLHEVPAAMSVMSADQIEEIPSDDMGDLLRNVPGLNVAQMSARDIVVTGRSATNSLAASQLVLLDGRTLYLDFFGFVMWDFLPVNTREIKQIEVVRGPGSAVWGANAMSGVINLITKAPREMVGTSVTLGAGEFSTRYGSVTHAGVRGNLGYKLSGGYYEQDPYERPTGVIPGSEGELNPGGTLYPPFENKGTEQPKLDLRFDHHTSEETTWRYSAGWAATDGIIHTGIGPFDIDSGSAMGYAKVDWNRRAMRASLFLNHLDGDADNLLTVGADGAPLAFAFESDTFNLDWGNTSVIGASHILTYGVTARQNEFDLSLAPQGDERQELGAFLQDEILIGDKVRWLVGARVDDIDPIGTVVSPRTSLLVSPSPDHTFRVSYNRAFQAPSMIQNFLDITIFNQVSIPPLAPGVPGFDFVFPSTALGNVDLEEERLDAVEVGWVGTFGRTNATVSVYRNETTDSQDFFQATFYSPTNPPPGWPTDPGFLAFIPLPETFSYRNIGEVTNQGVELSLDVRPRVGWSLFLNYSWQDEPDIEGVDKEPLPNGELVDPQNIPPEHRANFGLSYNTDRYYINGNVNYQDEAFWTDVLDSRFWGPTDSFTSLNLGAGVRFSGDRVVLSVTAQNVTDEDIQQHVFGDLIERKVTGQVTFNF